MKGGSMKNFLKAIGWLDISGKVDRDEIIIDVMFLVIMILAVSAIAYIEGKIL